MATLADQVDALSQRAVAQLRADLRQVLERITGYLEALLKTAHQEGGKLTADAFNRELAAKLGRGYADALRTAGYDKALAKVLDAFEAIAEESSSFIADELGASYSAPNLMALTRLAEGSVDHLLLRGAEAGDKLRDIVVAGANSNAPISDLVEELSQAAGVPLNQAVVEAQTQLMAFHRDGLAVESQEAGIDLFTYEGPEDGITRPFCDPYVGKIVTLQDLDEQDNGDNQPKPVSRFLGGYRCRHSLAPISLEEARALYESGGRSVVGPGCRLALRIVSGKEDGPAYEAWLERNRGGVVKGKVVRRKKRVA